MGRPDKHKTSNPERRFLPFWVAWLMTSSPKPLELDISKSGRGSPWGDKHKANLPEMRFCLFGRFDL